MRKFLFVSLFFLSASLASSLSFADSPGPFRLGVGTGNIHFHHAPQGIPDGDTYAAMVFAEFAQNNYHATRLMAYRFDSDDTNLKGAETQLLIGYGLAKQGPRIYTGPTWYFERMQLTTNDRANFHGFGWQAGIGWQYRAFAVDYSFGVRDNHPYHKKMKKIGYDASHIFQNNLLFSYHF